MLYSSRFLDQRGVSRRPFGRAVPLVVALVLVASACGGGGDDTASDGVASLGETTVVGNDASGDEAVSGADVEAPENPEDAFALYEECMSDAGFGFETDPGGGDGGIVVEGFDPDSSDAGADPQSGSGSVDDFDIDVFTEAEEACQAHLGNIDIGFDLSPEQEAALEDAELKWRDCMSDEGIDVPEFDGASGGVIIVEAEMGRADPQDGSDPQRGDAVFDEGALDIEGFEEAEEKCSKVYEELDDLLESPGLG